MDYELLYGFNYANHVLQFDKPTLNKVSFIVVIVALTLPRSDICARPRFFC